MEHFSQLGQSEGYELVCALLGVLAIRQGGSFLIPLKPEEVMLSGSLNITRVEDAVRVEWLDAGRVN